MVIEKFWKAKKIDFLIVDNLLIVNKQLENCPECGDKMSLTQKSVYFVFFMKARLWSNWSPN